MPVWHKATKALRTSGKLAVVGITQEQHPARCRLFAQWHGIDWPILWDPFNRTGSKVVPRFLLIDEHGVVHSTRARPDDLAAFVAKTFPKPTGEDPAPPGKPNTLIAQNAPPAGMGPAYATLSSLLWRPDAAFPDLNTLKKCAAREASLEHQFWLGVAYLMRHEDAQARQQGDFQRAIGAWVAALGGNPSQYIWRRRIQQFGPRMDKPYPFYNWVEQAQADLQARGVTPVPLKTVLTQSEIAGRRGTTSDSTEPDPDAKVARSKLRFEVERAEAPATKRTAKAAQVHLFLYPPDGAKWDLDATLPTLWTGAEVVRPHPKPDDRGAWRFEFAKPANPGPGYVLLPLCLDSGTCTFVRLDIDLAD